MQGGSSPGTVHTECLTDTPAWPTPAAGSASVWAPAPDVSERVACLARTLEREVIPRLAAAHRPGQHAEACNDASAGALVAAQVEAFCACVISGSEHDIAAMVSGFRQQGLSVQAIFIELLAPTARHLGAMWEDDRCDFATVTVGLGRLQRLMRELSPAFGTEVDHPPSGRRVLLVRAPGEQHSFGLSMVAEFFRRTGWEVMAGGAGADTDPITAVRREWFDVVGFSVGSEARLDWLPSCIAAVRRASCHVGLPVMVGGPVFALRPLLAKQVGADATTADGSEAPGLAERLLAGRVKRN
jgi:MerR family transcriptional regulator, light-induced transcriptional regulator